MPYDFFLSYASLDDGPAIPRVPESKWVTTFREALVGRLQFYLRRQVDVFFDCADLSGNAALTPRIEAALNDSHLFVAISSPTYYARPWCKLERTRFITRLGPNPVTAERIFVIHTIDVDPLIKPQTWQGEFFPDLKGYYFFREDADGRLHTLGSPALHLPIADGNSYYIEIERLAQDMAKRIRELELPVEPAFVAQEAGLPANDLVFLAENAFRSHAEREELRIALRDAGFDVRPQASLAGKPASELLATMNQAVAFVQIVSTVLLEIPGGQGKMYDQVQLDAARAGGIPVFRWRAPDLDIAAAAAIFPGYNEFANASDVRRQLLPQFREDLVTELKGLRARRRMTQAVQGDERLVLITGEQADLATHGDGLTQQLQNYALGHYITDFPAEELEAEDVHGFLILYGGSKAEWVRDQLRILRRLPKTRLRALRVGVYFCPPPPDLQGRRLLFDMPSFQKIRWDDQESLEAFAVAVAQ
jgi:hypothetical protein